MAKKSKEIAVVDLEELEGEVLLPWVRTSERSAFKKCPQSWWWGYIEAIEPVGQVIGAREFGTGIHLCMERYYIPGLKRGTPLLETWEAWCATQDSVALAVYDDDGQKEWVDMKQMGIDMLTNYDEVWGGDPNWEVIAAELHFQINVNGKAIDVGTIDLVVRNVKTGKIYIIDHKTCKAFPNVDWFELDNQNGSYSAVAQQVLRDKGLIGPNEKVTGFLYNFLRKGKLDQRPVNKDGFATNKPIKKHYVEALVADDSAGERFQDQSDADATEKYYSKLTLTLLEAEASERGLTVLGDISKVQPTPLMMRHPVPRTNKEKNRQLDHLTNDVIVMDAVRNKLIPVLKAPSDRCTWCDFFLLCKVDESKGDTEMYKKRMFKSKDPYADHREGAESSKIFVGKGGS